jgi:diguanylate cyclase (GGDEF)-like protein
MRDLNDSRDISPRIGSPLWTYLTAVTAVGAVVLGLGLRHLTTMGLPEALRQPLPWVIAALALIGELRPIITPGKTGSDSGDASLTFCFAALLYWGFPLAVLMRSVISVTSGIVSRGAFFRSAFNAAQYTLSLGAASLVLAVGGVHPQPLVPWVPGGAELVTVGLAAVAYFAANFLLVGLAVALHARAPILATLRKELPHQAFISMVLLSAAPLVVVVMGRSVFLVLLFLVPLVAIYSTTSATLVREHQALHDELTGLPNRMFLLRNTADALAEAARMSRSAGFLLLDLDRFKEVNDALGHPVGDSLLRMVAHRLTHSVRPGDVVARLGGDEFAVLLPAVRGGDAAREVAARLRAALAQPVHLEGMTFAVEASVGIAIYPDDATEVELLLQRADVAMYLAKERRTGMESYAREVDRNSAARLSLLGDLRRGLDRDELALHYQPLVSLADRRTCGMEALIRWHHPRRGTLMPAEFLPAAEQSYLMRDLTAFTVNSALAQTAEWRRAGLPVPVSLNLAARELLDAGLADMVGKSLERYGLAPGDLTLEISERVLAGEPTHAAMTLNALAARGARISLDDFGTGYSSLVRLKRLPVNEVKIDASFITRLLDGSDNEMIVQSVVDLVRALGIRSVAEAVETAEVADHLVAMGCDAAQGRYFSCPLEVAAATEWLVDQQRAAAGVGSLFLRSDGARRGSDAPGGSRSSGAQSKPVQRAAGLCG